MPCQPFSNAGRREGTNDERHLWPHVREAIRYLRPRYTFLENVRGHLSLGFDTVLRDLTEDGLTARWTTLRAADVGAPHNRERLFILVADPNSLGLEAPVGCSGGSSAEVSGDYGGVGAFSSVDWGGHAPIVRRWERVTGLAAPCPVEVRDGRPQLSIAFSEWLMGLPAGWVTGVPGLRESDQLKAIGNGVVPLQAAAALRFLLSDWGSRG